jgi:diguanylate cyclase (GGDEF)-like protein
MPGWKDGWHTLVALVRGRRPEARPPAPAAEGAASEAPGEASPQPVAPGSEGAAAEAVALERPVSPPEPADKAPAPDAGETPPVAGGEAAEAATPEIAPEGVWPTPSREEDLEAEIRDLRAEAKRLREALAEETAARTQLEEEIRALADHDLLTGVASGRRFGDRCSIAIVQARRNRQKLAVVQLGLDQFGKVNDRLGRGLGDDLLKSVALALESTLRQGDTIARFSGDVFTILLPGIKRDEDVTVIADKLRLALRSPFSIGGHDLLVTASLGIALFPDDGPDADSLVQSAAVAMKRAKGRGGDAWDVHAPRSRALAAERQAREGALRRALVQGELALFWQPVVECETGAISAVEALLRWRDPKGLVSAADFVSLADVSGLAVPLGQWTLRAACVQGRSWHEAGHQGLIISVNISARQLAHAALVKLVRRVLDETNLPPDRLELEVPETELARSPEIAIERLTELRRLGLRIALDDFGTGESRLVHLYRYPIDTLKIDGSVIKDASTNRDHEAVITAAVALARSRKLRVVAEGVETEAQRVLLVRWQCDRMQGRFCGPPATAAETEQLLIRQRKAVHDLAGQRAGEVRRLL